MVARSTPDRKVGGSIPSRVKLFFSFSIFFNPPYAFSSFTCTRIFLHQHQPQAGRILFSLGVAESIPSPALLFGLDSVRFPRQNSSSASEQLLRESSFWPAQSTGILEKMS